ncbi:glycosyltransferase family 4 protein [Candidatus Oleimmundimicrobium sp.]|uniref:glycosyltransferase family 4 protein n=1 Tax=Candidatus Oleimmundimicrobium sp. TaxID=3060597 RepID=UPI00271754B9|nr:glycosyltransferase family 4 protein [Candidatus Oleimmundimicrobium sp.]MDO8886366.1 glycosyltransferase family 4 protein [Candidatus Oleimmundimicrobium sp.]
MKILIINTHDISGGAARAAYRLHQALLEAGVESRMLVQSKKSADETVIGRKSITIAQKAVGIVRPQLDGLPTRIYNHKTKTLFSPSWVPMSSVIRGIENFDPDVVHLHWICGGMMSIEDIGKIKKPIVWSLHDMWAFTGGCHYDKECGKYVTSCGSCSVLGSKKEYDLSRHVFLRKQKAFADMDNIIIIGLSRWLADCAQKSALFASKRVLNLPNPIDTRIFAPIKKQEARMVLNLPMDKKIILYGAMSATSDPRKGYNELIKALRMIPQDSDTELLVFGSSGSDNTLDCNFKIHYLGNIHEDLLPSLYSAADVMVVPSLQENLSNAIMESLACGTPVIAFAIGGNGDLIDHKLNGYLAEPFSSADLAEGISCVLNSAHPELLAQNAREKVLRCFDRKVVAKKYIELYKSVIR